MKKFSFFLMMFTALSLGFVSCDKDDDDDDNSNSGTPTFADLYKHLGRTDIDVLISEFTKKGYPLEWDEDYLYYHTRTDGYEFKVEDGTVVKAEYGCLLTKDFLFSKFDEEKKFRSQSGLVEYRGGYYIEGEGESNYSSKDELRSALKNINLSDILEGWSVSYYSDVRTDIDLWGSSMSYSVKLPSYY